MAKAINVETITATNLSTVATSGNYNDLKNKPTIPNISNCVTTDQLANVATSGNYEDLINKPTIPEAYNDTSLREALNQKANKSELFSKNYNDLTNKPTIPAAVTESTVSNWGFTKNTGTITDITMNGVSKGTSGTVDLGTIDTATKITWNASSNMNDFKTPGVYEIYGERTVKTDNLPVTNEGGGNSIAARLTVVASTLQPNNSEICVTQFLQLSNRIGGEGTTYVRTYNENNNGMNGWSSWQKQMGMIETLINSDDTTVDQRIFSDTHISDKIGDGLNGMIDNGMYSGIYINNLSWTGTGSMYYLSTTPTFIETFVLVVINDYAASGKLNLPRHITQLKYAVDAITGQSTVKKRVGTGNDTISWSDWEDIGGESREVDITDAVKAEGLPTFISQGYAKEGVTYKIYCPKGDFANIVLDRDKKLSNEIINNTANPPSWAKVLFNVHFIKEETGSDFTHITGKYYTDVTVKEFVIQSNYITVKVSNMTEL